MYGIVNKAIEELVVANFGKKAWSRIKKRSGIDVDYFISHEPYDDDVTYKLAGAVSEEMNMHIDQVMQAFGEWWILKTGKEKYGGMMAAGGNNLRDFLINLPAFHSRVMMIYQGLTPPEFKVSDMTDDSINVHYHSKREGLKEFVRGLLTGLAKMYQTDITVELLKCRDEGDTHEIYKVTWV